MTYSELQVTTNFSFLLGASHPWEFVEEAIKLGYSKIAITDRNTVAGVVRAHMAAKKTDKGTIGIIPACRLDLQDGPSLLAYPTDTPAWSLMCGMLTKGNMRTEKGKCLLYKQDVYEHKQGMKFIIVPPDNLNAELDFDADFKAAVDEYARELGENVYIAASRTYSGDDSKRMYRLSQLPVRMVATNDVHYHCQARRQLQDIETCVKEKCTIHTAGFKLHANAERYLKPVEELERLFAHYPDAIACAREIAEACNFSLDTLKYLEPEYVSKNGRSADEDLAEYTWAGANKRYKNNIPKKIKDQLTYELDFFARRKLSPYFIRVYEYTKKAEELQILFQGRGSAANSAVCYCLGITGVDPDKSRLLFSRFMSDAREEWPDVDVDFEHERREEIMQWIYEEYGRDHAAVVATVTELRHKGAIRDVGKAMGLSLDAIKRLGSGIWSFSEDGLDPVRLEAQGINPEDPLIKKTLDLVLQMKGFPRQLGQHTGGFVITRCKLSDICPVLNARMENRTQLEWNKDDLEDLKILKVDVLALGMLSCIRRGFDLLKQHYNLPLTLATVPPEEDEVYDMICKADTVGVFQIESRAQMSMLPRLKPRKFYDLVIEVAIVRPGPIQGDMVHPYLKRREDPNSVTYPSKALEEVLSRTLGVPLFQEQAMEIAIVAGGFSPEEADQLRRSMATFKAKGEVSEFRDKLVNGMIANGYEEEFARRVFKQLEGFGSYGFPESHAASFAHLVYISSWMKCFYPDVFAAAILNSQPMGFYQPAELVDDARNHGVAIRPVDVNRSQWDHTLEADTGRYKALRLGFRLIKGLREDEMKLLVANAPYDNINQLADAGIEQATLERLADADAFRSIGLDRRDALWEVAALGDRPVQLFEGQRSESLNEQIELPLMTLSEHVVHDLASTGLSIKAHPVSFVRNKLNLLRAIPTINLRGLKNGDHVRIAGLITVRQRPGTAKGVLFITIKDESSYANIVVWESIFQKCRRDILAAKLLMVDGTLQIEGQVIHVVARHCYDATELLKDLTPQQNAELELLMSRADETSSVVPAYEVIHKGRNFK